MMSRDARVLRSAAMQRKRQAIAAMVGGAACALSILLVAAVILGAV